jgi:DNA polymerase I-like protein with 3'-5' exonuclease and polymerase domains
MAKGNAMDSYFTLKAFHKLKSKLEDMDMWPLFENMIIPAIPFFAEMEHGGMLISAPRVKEIGKELEAAIIEKEDKLFSYKEVPDKSCKMTSTNDMMRILYSCDPVGNIKDGGFNLYPPMSTPEGSPSSSVDCLDIILEQINEELNARNV